LPGDVRRRDARIREARNLIAAKLAVLDIRNSELVLVHGISPRQNQI
jgi:hypothetical protein